ncbi:MAG: DUF167 domain-containing protein [Verrucomicrobia bacterium]|nr:DUF167 domain-containing protein [Verrucomicrobiota bacterium]
MGRLKLRIVPNAKRNEVTGEHGDAVKIKVAAPAIEGKANEALLEFIAEKLGIHRRNLTLIAGEKSRDKLIEIAGLDATEARGRLFPS